MELKRVVFLVQNFRRLVCYDWSQPEMILVNFMRVELNWIRYRHIEFQSARRGSIFWITWKSIALQSMSKQCGDISTNEIQIKIKSKQFHSNVMSLKTIEVQNPKGKNLDLQIHPIRMSTIAFDRVRFDQTDAKKNGLGLLKFSWTAVNLTSFHVIGIGFEFAFQLVSDLWYTIESEVGSNWNFRHVLKLNSLIQKLNLIDVEFQLEFVFAFELDEFEDAFASEFVFKFRSEFEKQTSSDTRQDPNYNFDWNSNLLLNFEFGTEISSSFILNVSSVICHPSVATCHVHFPKLVTRSLWSVMRMLKFVACNMWTLQFCCVFCVVLMFFFCSVGYIFVFFRRHIHTFCLWSQSF